jgi:hypothetical protein
VKTRFWRGESGVSLIVVMLMLMLVAALLAGFTAVVMSEQRLQRVDEDRTQSFYGAHAGLEKLTSDLGALFSSTYAPTGTQVNALNANPPVLSGVSFVTTTDGPGYGITFAADANGNPAATTRSITQGSFQGFTGLVTTYVVAVTARTGNIGETRLQREVETVAIPLFQFGMFSDVDLGFHPGPDFDFGGRVHTNGNLFLAAGSGLYFADKVSAAKEVVRTHLMNGVGINNGWTGTVYVTTTPGSYRALATTEGSLVNTIGSAQNEPTWNNISLTTYHGYITNGRTGARTLSLPVVDTGNTPIDLIRRPLVGESTTQGIYLQRYYSMASLRILLSDTAAELTGLPSVTGTAPIELGTAEPAGYGNDATRPQFAQAPATVSGTYYRVGANQPLLGGFIKIEKQVTAGVWQDVTLEILNLGIAGRNLASSGCSDQSPNAVIRIQRLANSTSACAPSAANQVLGTSYWPMVFYDTREALRRDNESTSQNSNVYMAGVMNYVELDVRNLTRWFNGTIGTTGTTVLHETGYTVFFSDRRGNKNAASQETGEFGWEDSINPTSSSGAPNGSLDSGEDVNGNSVLDNYGQTPGGPPDISGWTSPYDNSVRPTTLVAKEIAQQNPTRFFRRALKLTNGALGNIISPGLAIASENPVYIQGNFNANNSGFGNPHVACSISADAITLLSNSWSDYTSFTYPHKVSSRQASNTWYRFAALAGKGLGFPYSSTASSNMNFGSDGGTHNFLRFLEDWTGDTVYYRGSIASLFYNRQALGVFKDGDNTYSPPERDFAFDTDFLTPSLLPPRTPMFRDINTLGFFPVNTPPR